MIKKELSIDVLQAAEMRVLQAFKNGPIVYLSVSGGKDSICLFDIVLKTMAKHGIDYSRLCVVFFDEEAIYPDIERIVMGMRDRALGLGAKFLWFCLPIKHFNCVNQLENDESFICWEKGKEDVWVRPMPRFAIRQHAKFKPGMNYQKFMDCALKGESQLIGLRAYESVQRMIAIAKIKKNNGKIYPLYDWKDYDVWRYIMLNDLDYPETYVYLYKTGVNRNKLRISQFFSIDTIKTLPKVMEFYPDLYERVIRREPNAEIAMLYYETSMFRSSKQDNAHDVDKDYKTLFWKEYRNGNHLPGYKDTSYLLSLTGGGELDASIYRDMYNLLLAGDPKDRVKRVLVGKIKRNGIA